MTKGCKICRKLEDHKKHHKMGSSCGPKCHYCRILDTILHKHKKRDHKNGPMLKSKLFGRSLVRRRFGRSRRLRRSRFGKISNLNSMMGNNSGNDMSAFQSYTGLSPNQMQTHLTGIPTNLRDTYYSNNL